MSSRFTPSREWQTVKADEAVPPGCHVRLNLQTGLREAKLLDENESRSVGAELVSAYPSTHAPEPEAVRAAKAADPETVNAKNAARGSFDKLTKEQETETTKPNIVVSEDDRRRQPRDWKGLLEWSLTYMDGTQPSDKQRMDPERQRWLEQALKEMSSDEIELMKNALKSVVRDYDKCFDGTLTDDELRSKEMALENLHDLVDLIDNAQDLISLGGYPAIVSLLGAVYPSLVWRSLNVLATTVQNNAVCQKYCLDQHMLGKLMELVGEDKDPMVRVKALYTVSGLTRGHDEATKAFALGNGLGLLRSCIATPDAEYKLATKAAFMLNHLVIGGIVSADSAAELENLIPMLLQVATGSHGNEQLQEQALATLNTLVERSHIAVDELKRPELELQKRLQALRENISVMDDEEQDAHQEQLRHIMSLQEICQ